MNRIDYACPVERYRPNRLRRFWRAFLIRWRAMP